MINFFLLKRDITGDIERCGSETQKRKVLHKYRELFSKLFAELACEGIILPLKIPFFKNNKNKYYVAEVGEYPFDNTFAIYGAKPDDEDIWSPKTDIAEVRCGEDGTTTKVWSSHKEKKNNMVIVLFLFQTGDASVPYYDVPVLVEETANFREIERLAKEPCDEENYEDTVKRVLDSTSTKIWWQFFDKNANVNITGVNYILV